MFMKSIRATAVSAAIILAPAFAHAEQQVRVRGTIETIDASSLTVQAASGQNIVVNLAKELTVLQYAPLAVADIAPKAYLGVAAHKVADGSFEALTVIVFPDAMRGYGEGTMDWDLMPGSRMTNATAGEVVSKPEGREIKLTFNGGTQTINVPDKAHVVTFAPADKALLKAGTKVIVFGSKNADGSVNGGVVGFSKDGSLPPL
jgi:Domain of unknown function (DUF5666)